MVVVDDERRVVREALGLVDRFPARGGGHARRGDLVVDAPADVLLPRLAAVRPPRVLIGLVVQLAEHIDETQLVEDARQPCALLGQEAGVLLVGAPVPEIDLPVRDVPVAAQDDFLVSVFQALQVQQEVLQEAEFRSLAMLAGRARRHIHRHHPELAEARLDVATLSVELAALESTAHFVRGLAAIQGDAAIALFLGEGMAGLKDLETVQLGVEVDFLALHLLQAYDIGALPGEPAEKPLVRRRPNAVYVKGDDPQVAFNWRQERPIPRRGPRTTAPARAESSRPRRSAWIRDSRLSSRR